MHAHAQLCLTLCDPMDCSPPVSSGHGIFQARILEWAAIASFRGSSWLRDWTHVFCVSCTVGGFFTCWAIREAHFAHMWHIQKISKWTIKNNMKTNTLKQKILVIPRGEGRWEVDEMGKGDQLHDDGWELDLVANSL